MISETKTNKTSNNKKRKGDLPKTVTMKLPFYIKRRIKKVYRDKDIQMAMQIAAAILIICFIVSRF